MILNNPVTTRGTGVTDPADHGFIAWTFDPTVAGTNSLVTTAGTMQGGRLYIPRQVTVTNLVMYIQVAAATLTSGQNFGAIYNSAGTLVGTTVDQSTLWTTGLKLMALATPVVCPPGYYDIVVWYNGTTAPSCARGSALGDINGNVTGTSLRFFTADTGRTTTAPSTLGTKTQQFVGWFLAVN